MTAQPTRPAVRRCSVRGMSLIDALVALALLAFGMLGMTTMLSRLIAQGTDAQTRLTAAQLGDELLNLALVDAANAACYTLPAAGTCGKAAARTLTNDWQTRVLAALPSASVTSTLGNDGRLEVVLNWSQKDGADSTERARTLRVTTDVRN